MKEAASGEVLNPTAGLQIASAGGHNVLQPLRLRPIGQCHCESVWRSEDVDRRAVHLVGLPSAVDDHPESRHPAGERCHEVVGHPSVDARNPSRNRHATASESPGRIIDGRSPGSSPRRRVSIRCLYLAGGERLLPDSATEFTAASECAVLGSLPLTPAGPTPGRIMTAIRPATEVLVACAVLAVLIVRSGSPGPRRPPVPRWPGGSPS